MTTTNDPQPATRNTVAGNRGARVTGLLANPLAVRVPDPGDFAPLVPAWRNRRLIPAAFAIVGVASAAVFVWLGELQVALLVGTIGATWLAVSAGESGWRDGYRFGRSSVVERAIESAKTEATRVAEQQLRLAAEVNAALAPEPPATITGVTAADRDGDGFIYVVRFSTDMIKVGQTKQPRTRLHAHRRDAAVYGVEIVDYWVSPQHSNYLTNEIALIALCETARITTKFKKEYFQGLDFAVAVRFAASLAFSTTGVFCEATR